MIALRRKLLPTLALFAGALTAACGDDTTEPPALVAPTSVTVTALGATSARITFEGHSGDDSYVVERAPGASGGTFASVATPPRPATGTSVSVDDNGLTANTTYRYRVTAIRGTSASAASAETPVTTTDLPTTNVTLDITTNTTWTADHIYLLKGFIHVTSGATLTIEAGTTIKGATGTALFILRGAKINAVGTAASPIVFTSDQAVGSRKPGDWGGLIIIGNATINRTGTPIALEGSGTNGGGTANGTNYQLFYSDGNTDTDNSGELKYVRVEFAGFAPVQDQELNSFTFAAVGSGTKFSYLQALAGLDDSYEFFGGTVDGDHFVAYETGDDAFDMSEGYRGRLQYLISFNSTQLAPRQGQGGTSTDPEGIENDGCAAPAAGCTGGFNTTPFTIPVVANFTLVGTNSTASSGTGGGIGMMLRRGTGGYYVNGIVARFPRAGVSLRDADTYTRAGTVATQDLATADLAVKNVLFVETPTTFQGANGTNVQNALDLAGNALVNNTTATAATIFTAFPATVTTTTTEAAFDWTPVASSAPTSGGIATFTGKLATKTATASSTGNTVTGTAYVGAVNAGGTKWWQGWTKYAQQ